MNRSHAPARSRRRAVVLVVAAALLAGAGALALLPEGAGASPFRQGAGGSAPGGTQAVSRLAPTAAGATIVVCVGADTPAVAVTDDQSNRYVAAGSAPNSSGAGNLAVFYARNAKGGVTTVTATHAWGHSDIVAAEYGPTGTVDRFAAADSGYNQGSAWSSGRTSRTRASGELVVGCAFEVYGSEVPVTFTPGPGYTARTSQRGLFLMDAIAANRAGQTATGQRAPAENLNVVAAVATFRPAPASPPPPPPATTASTEPSTTADTTATSISTVPTDTAPTTTAPATTSSVVTPSTTPPAPAAGLDVLFTDVLSGPTTGGPDGLGVPIAVYGTGFGATRGASTVTIGGVEVARYLQWGQGNAHNPDLDMIVVQPGPAVTGGQVVVTVGGQSSSADVRFTPAPAARIYTVARTGSDAAECSLAAPCATIGEVATRRMAPGDIVLVRGGTYPESEVWIRSDQGHSGAPGAQKVIKAYPGETVVLDNAARPFIVDADHITVAGLEFRNGKSLGIPDTGLPGHTGNRFIDNTFTGVIAWGAIDTHGDGHLVAGNVCDVSGSTVGTQGHCYYISYGSGVQLRYNVGRGAPGYGIHVFDQQRSSQDFRRTITNLLIEGNNLADSSLRSGLIVAMADEGGRGNQIDGVIVRGNRFAANSHLGMLVTGRVRNVTISGNTFDQNGRQGLHVADDSGVSQITVTGNTFTQSANGSCRQDCTWYELAHLQVGARATGVTVSGNRYGPGSPVVIGATDPAPG